MKEQFLKLQSEVESGKTIDSFTASDKQLVYEILNQIDQGKLRVCSQNAESKKWETHAWVKQAILIYFRLEKVVPMAAGDLSFADKIKTKKWTGAEGVRVVPPAVARFGSFIESGAILMPSYVNIGAYVGSGSMIDTWATVGSCAQIGKNCHLSGGVGIGGVLEPAQAQPVIIEDHVFIGSRCIVVEGAHIGEGAVLGAGVTITASTKIIDVSGPTKKEFKGHIPANSVVIPGTTKKSFPAGEFDIPCALIIGQRHAGTDKKTSLNQTLREFDLSV